AVRGARAPPIRSSSWAIARPPRRRISCIASPPRLNRRVWTPRVPAVLLRAGFRLARRELDFRRLFDPLELDTSRMRARIHWTPPISLDEGLEADALGALRLQVRLSRRAALRPEAIVAPPPHAPSIVMALPSSWGQIVSLTVGAPAERVRQIVGREQVVDHCGSTDPVEGPIAMAGRNEACARVKHLVLRVARAEFGADRVPGCLHEFDLPL